MRPRKDSGEVHTPDGEMTSTKTVPIITGSVTTPVTC